MTVRATGDALMQRLAPVSEYVRNKAKGHFRLIGQPFFEATDIDDFQQFCRVAAFNAFTDLGGDPEAPEAFPWDDQAFELRRRSLMLFNRDTQGLHTTYGDFRARNCIANPRTQALSPTEQWSAWNAPAVDHLEPSDAERRERQFELVERDLMEVLNERECWLIRKLFYEGTRYVKGGGLRAVAKEYAAAHPEEFGTDDLGWRRCEKALSKCYERAIAKARVALGPRWNAIVGDVA